MLPRPIRRYLDRIIGWIYGGQYLLTRGHVIDVSYSDRTYWIILCKLIIFSIDYTLHKQNFTKSIYIKNTMENALKADNRQANGD